MFVNLNQISEVEVDWEQQVYMGRLPVMAQVGRLRLKPNGNLFPASGKPKRQGVNPLHPDSESDSWI